MKKSLLSILAVLFGMTTPMLAQEEYIPLVNEGVTWKGDMKIRHNNTSENQESYAYTIELKGDTVINDLTYKKCYYHFYNLKIYDNSTLRGFLREDIVKRQVFFLANKDYYPKNKFNDYENPSFKLNEEILLYDFADIKNPEQYWLANAGDECGNILTAGRSIELNDGVSRRFHSLVGGYIIEGVGFYGEDGHDLINVFSIDNHDVPMQSYPSIYAMYDANGNEIYNELYESNYTPLAIEGNKWMCGKVDVTAQGTTHTPYCYFIKGEKEVNGKTYKCCYKLIGDDEVIDESKLYAFLRDDIQEHKTFVLYPDADEESILYDFYNPHNTEMLKNFGHNDIPTDEAKIEEYIMSPDGSHYRLRLSATDYNLYYIEGVGFDGTQRCDLFNAPAPIVPGLEYSYIQFYKLIGADGNMIYTSPATDPTIDNSNYVPLVKEGVKWECVYHINPWHSVPCDIPYTIEIKGDTTINNIAYKCCVYTFEEGVSEWDNHVYPAETHTLAFIREDVENKKVYALFNESPGHGLYSQFGNFQEINGEFLLYDFDYINNPKQVWQKSYDPQGPLSVTAEKITIDGVDRNCYAIGQNGEYGYIIEGIGYDGYGFNQNAGDLIGQFPSFVAGTDELPVFKAYKNAEGKTIYTTGDAVNAFNGVEKIEADNNAPVEYYNLQGIKVANPHGGIFIKKQGNKVSKVIVK